jgi:hypothetical protein
MKHSIKAIMTSIIFLKALDFQYIRHITFQIVNDFFLISYILKIGEYAFRLILKIFPESVTPL